MERVVCSPDSAPSGSDRGVRSWVGAHQVEAFFGLAITLSWSYWFADIAAGGHWTHFPGLLGPALAAFAVARITDREKGIGDLWMAVTRWRVSACYYAAALVPIAIAGVVVGVQALTGDAPSLAQLSRMDGVPPLGWFGVLAVVLVVNGFGEEVGWRGFAWSRLREHRSLAGAALWLAMPWAIWHIPLFWIDSGMRSVPLAFFPVFALSLACGAVVLGWLYERSGAIVVVALWHTMMNMASATDGTTTAAPFVSAVVIIAAIAILRLESSASRR